MWSENLRSNDSFKLYKMEKPMSEKKKWEHYNPVIISMQTNSSIMWPLCIKS